MDATAEFSPLGFGEPVLVSALHGEGTGDLLDAIVDWFPKRRRSKRSPQPCRSPSSVDPTSASRAWSTAWSAAHGPSYATTRDKRDAIDSQIVRDGQTILLIDNGGHRRRGRVQPGVEKFSVCVRFGRSSVPIRGAAHRRHPRACWPRTRMSPASWTKPPGAGRRGQQVGPC